MAHWKPRGTVCSTGSAMRGRLRPVDALELARRLGGPVGRPGSARVTRGRDGGGLVGRRPVEGVTYPSRPLAARVGGEAGGAVRGGRRGRGGARPRRSVRALRQPRQRRQHAAPSLRARRRRALPAVLRQRPPGHGLQVPREHRGLRAGARHGPRLRRGRARRRRGRIRQEHHRGHQHPGALDADGRRRGGAHDDARAPLQRPPVAVPGRGRARPRPSRRHVGRGRSRYATSAPSPAASPCWPSAARRT